MLLGRLGRSQSGTIAQRISKGCREVVDTLLERHVLAPRKNMLGFEITERIGPVKSSWYSFAGALNRGMCFDKGRRARRDWLRGVVMGFESHCVGHTPMIDPWLNSGSTSGVGFRSMRSPLFLNF